MTEYLWPKNNQNMLKRKFERFTYSNVDRFVLEGTNGYEIGIDDLKQMVIDSKDEARLSR